MKRLPVPPLAQTMQRYLQTLEPLLTSTQLRAAQRDAANFLVGDGPQCQAEMERFAAEQDAVGGNWMAQDWLAGYLQTQTPVCLSTNFGAQLAWPRQPDVHLQAADLITRIAAVHLAHLRGETAPQVSPRGDVLDMQQWRYLAGGVRHPGPDGSRLIDGPSGAADREVVILHRGHAFALRVGDSQGRPLPAAAIAGALRTITRDAGPDEGGFGDLAALGAQDASQILVELLRRQDNRHVYEHLVNSLFVIDLATTGGPDAEQVHRTAFAIGQSWPLKSTSYRVSLVDGWTGVQIEHSIPDGGTVDAVVQRALDLPPVTGEAEPPVPVPLRWQMSPPLAQRLADGRARYERKASTLGVRIVSAPFHLPDGLKLTLDGAMQWVMLYAQLEAYGRIRSVYESVAMAEYQAGRTECLRPVTAPAVTLARGLLTENATPDDLEAARRAHSNAVVACKTGQAIDRHLWGLRSAAGRLGLPEPTLFSGEGYRALTTDFLSTTTLGGQSGIVRFAFAPTSEGGIGVNYTPVAKETGAVDFEFCVTHRQDVSSFVQALQEGTHRLDALVRQAAR